MNPPIEELEALIEIVIGPLALIASGAAIAAFIVLLLSNLLFEIADRG